jgi:hypothetical protein
MKLFEKFLMSIDEAFDAKDEMRIRDIVSKSGGDESKQVSLATSMAKLITDKDKAQRRAEAAEDAGYDDLASIFKARAKQLGADIADDDKAEKEDKTELKAVATKEIKKKPGKLEVGDYARVTGDMVIAYNVEISDGKAWKYLTPTNTGNRRVDVASASRGGGRRGSYSPGYANIDKTYLEDLGEEGAFYIKLEKATGTWLQGRTYWPNGIEDFPYLTRIRTSSAVQPGPELKIFEDFKSEINNLFYAEKFFIGDEDFIMDRTGKTGVEIVPGSYKIRSLDYKLSVKKKQPVFYCVPGDDPKMENASVFFCALSDLQKLDEKISDEQITVVAEWMSKQIGAEVTVKNTSYRGQQFVIPYFEVKGPKASGYLSGFSASPFFTRDQAQEEIERLQKESKNKKLPYSTANLVVATPSYGGNYEISFTQLMDYAKLVGIEVKLREFFEKKRGAIAGKAFGF